MGQRLKNMPRSPHSPHAWRQRSSKWAVSSPELFKIESTPDPREGHHATSRLLHMRQSRVNQPDDALGDRVMSKGEHRFVFDIDSARSSGSLVRVGVASTDGRDRWGIRLTDGRSISIRPGVPTAEERERQCNVLLADKPIAAARQERAVSRRVEVIVDMARRHVFYSVDGGSAVDSGVLPEDYPELLVPWAQLFYKGDAVTLSQHRSRAVNHAARSPRLQPTPSKPSSPPPPAFDAGSWSR